ncbi:MAG: bifunctional uroporphyrinogen-III C-methyltransferase/uroporphyrinogen-III synthase [Gemmatimonadaceae bacterium]
MAEKGIVFVVGAGPGLAGLLTVRGRDLLSRADAVVYERRSQRKLIPGGPSGGPEQYYVGPRAKVRRVAVADVASLLVELARKDLRVVYLAHGDPLAFGRGTDLVTALHDFDVQFEIVPGVSTQNSAATYAGIPLLSATMASATIFANGRDPVRSGGTDWSTIARVGATVVVRNASAALEAIVAGYAAAGISGDIPAAAIVHAGRPNQRTIVATLGTIIDAMMRAGMMKTATVIIGWTVLLRDELAWFEARPLFGRQIILARSRYGVSTVGDSLREIGAFVIDVPKPGIARLDLDLLRAEIDRISDYEWIVFSTPDAVAVFWEQLILSGRDTRALANAKVACVDPATAASLLDRGITVDVTQEKFQATALIDDLSERADIPGASLLYVAEDDTAEPFARDLEQAGATVTSLALYREVPLTKQLERFRRTMGDRHTDLVVAMSPAAAEEYIRAAAEDAIGSVPAAAYDSATAQVLRDGGVDVAIENVQAGSDALVAAIRAKLDGSKTFS